MNAITLDEPPNVLEPESCEAHKDCPAKSHARSTCCRKGGYGLLKLVGLCVYYVCAVYAMLN